MATSTNLVMIRGFANFYQEKLFDSGGLVASFVLSAGTEKRPLKVDVSSWDLDADMRAKLNESKGKLRVAVLGKLSMDSWTDKATGKTRTKLKVEAETVTVDLFKPSKKTEGEGGSEPTQSAQRSPVAKSGPKKSAPVAVEVSGEGEDVPF